MKYIRTKDGIYEVIKKDFGVCIKFDCVFILLDDIKDEIIAESDNLAELCDEFHIEFDSLIFPREINYVKYYDFEIAKNNLEDGETLYGVIHIKGKGLIYVAKMDKDGKLCLL